MPKAIEIEYPINDTPVNTGVMADVSDEWVTLRFNPEACAKILRDGFFLVPTTMWEHLGLPKITNTGVEASELSFSEVKIEPGQC